MIARLRGILEEKSKERVVVDVNGVGYGLHVPDTVLLRLPEQGQEVTLQVHTHVREDHITLYGFSSRLEKDVFELLMSASGVGPKLALTILSSLEAMQILESLSNGNKMVFNGISGVGKKTVEKIFVEIHEKASKRLLQERGGEEASSTKRSAVATSSFGDVNLVADLEQALIALGYRENDVRVVVREILGKGSEGETLDSALRKALKLFSSGSKAANAARGAG